VARFLAIWRSNPVAPWPRDPVEYSKLLEMMWAVIDDAIKKGTVKEYGTFLEGTSGYAIGEGEATDVFKSVNMFLPYIHFEVHEIIPYEKEKEIIRALLKSLIAAAKK